MGNKAFLISEISSSSKINERIIFGANLEFEKSKCRRSLTVSLLTEVRFAILFLRSSHSVPMVPVPLVDLGSGELEAHCQMFDLVIGPVWISFELSHQDLRLLRVNTSHRAFLVRKRFADRYLRCDWRILLLHSILWILLGLD